MPRHAACDNPKRHAARIVVGHLSRYAWVIAAVVWKTGLGLDATTAAVFLISQLHVFMEWHVVMTFTVRTALVMLRFEVPVMERLPEPHLGQASGVWVSNSVGSGLLVLPS